MRYLFAIFLTCCACAAQSIAAGAIGGGRVTDDVLSFPGPGADRTSAEAAFRLESRFYDVGPTIEIGLTHHFALEFDAVYHRQGFFSTFAHDTLYSAARERDKIWEFPLLLKYKMRLPVLDPFVEAGVAPRTISGRAFEGGLISLSTPPAIPLSASSVPVSYSPSVGFVAGGGIQFNLRRLHVAPQVRYTRWATAPVDGLFYSIGGNTFSSNQNQLDLLVGISWKVK